MKRSKKITGKELGEERMKGKRGRQEEEETEEAARN